MKRFPDDEDLAGLPLLRWTPPRRVLVVPPSRVKGFVHEVVDRLADMPVRADRERYWRKICNGLRKRMAAAGEAPDAIDKHLDNFWEACRGEQVRREYEGQRGGHG